MVRSAAWARAGQLSRPALALACVALAAFPAPAQAPAAQPAGVVPVDSGTAARLVWWSLAALDQANQTGNYSVLRDLGVPSFQANNSAATLATAFQGFRAQHIDLSAVLNVIPTFETPPLVSNGILRARGVFALRPSPIGFDLLFQNIGGRWALFGISVVPLVQVQQRGGSTR